MASWRVAVASFVGMTFFWRYLRYQSFFGPLYPESAITTLLGLQVSAITICIVGQLVACAALLALGTRSCKLPAFLARMGMPLSVILGLVGVAGAFLAQSALIPSWCFLVSGPCAAVCFVLQYLGWGSLFAGSFTGLSVILTAGSYFVSLFVGGLFPILGIESGAVMAALTPTVSGVCWLVADRCTGDAEVPTDQGQAPASNERVTRLVLFATFLLVGAVVRGIVDIFHGGAGLNDFRWPVSIVVTALMLVGCVALWRDELFPLSKSDSPCADPASQRRLFHRRVAWFGTISWAALALLLCGGITWGLVACGYQTAGQLVVIARSTLDYVLWLLLVDVVAVRRSRPRTVLWLVVGAMIEAASWLISYVVVPRLLSHGTPLESSIQDTLVLGSLFVLIVMLIFALGGREVARGVLGSSRGAGSGLEGDASPDETQGPTLVAPVRATSLSSKGFEMFRLSPREVEVADLFARGLSIKAISVRLGISMGTVQSHLKNAYKKLGIHSRDELIGLLEDRG